MNLIIKHRNLLFLIFILYSGNNLFAQTEPKLPHVNESRYVCSRSTHDPFTEKQTGSTNKQLASCPGSLSGWASYGGSSLVQQLKSATDYNSCLRSLFDFDGYNGPIVFSNSNITAVAREMYNISISHNGTLSSGMLGLVTYLHAATYHEFFQSQISLNQDARYWYNNAAESFANNAHLWELTGDALSILDEYLIMCDYEGLRHKSSILSVVKEAMRKMTVQDNWKSIANDNSLLNKYATAYNRIFFLMFRGIQPVDPAFESAVNSDPSFIGQLYDIGVDAELSNNGMLSFMVDNAVGELARMSSSQALRPKVEPYLAQIAGHYPRLTPNWYRAVDAINKGSNCTSYGLCEDMNALRAEVETNLFPNTWSFDDGALVMRTPLPYEKAQNLYYAAKQVQAQMFRFIKTDAPVANDPNSTLNMIIYGSLKEYQEWQTLLYGLSSNNGGMYIERGATFYTYERTPQQSTFTLEELFRHEYVHYLQGRYLINGFWGEDPFYSNNRLVWFEEGMAEHFAGSTDTDGVRIRESQGSAIKNEGPSAYMTVNAVLNANYDQGFKFYRYGNMLWAYWFKYDMSTARELATYTRSGNISAFDTRINQLKSSSALQSAFTNFLNNEVIVPSNWWTVYTPWKKDHLYSIGDVNDIQTEFANITGRNASVSLDASGSLRRFKITGSFSSGNLESALNNIMLQLKAYEMVNNFGYITGYYKNVNGTSATYVISGPLRGAGTSNTAVAQFTADRTATISGGKIAFQNESTGYIKSYNWVFEGGTPSSSTAINPEITYNSPGNYTVALTAVGKDNVANTQTKNSFITVYNKSNLTYCSATVSYDYTEISAVSFAGISKQSSGFPTNGYSDFTHNIGEVEINKTYPLLVNTEYAWSENQIKAWIDWNQDGDFLDAGEEVLYLQGGATEGVVTVPASAASGVTRMRIRYAYGSVPQSCGVDTYMGEVEDYSIAVIGGSTGGDTQPPTAPTSLSAASVTTNSVSLSWGASSDNYGVAAYDVYVNNTKMMTVSTTSCSLQGLSPSTLYAFAVKARDAAGNQSAFSKTINVTTKSSTPVPTYCAAQSSDQVYEWIAEVSLGSFNKTSDKSAYSDFTSEVITIPPGSTNTITLTPGFRPNEPYMEYWAVYIDFNMNGDFSDAGEKVFTGQGTTSISGSISAPSGLSGTTRMRVLMGYNSEPAACGTFSSGEVEDYTVSFSGAAGPSHTAQSGNIIIYPVPTQETLNVRLSNDEEISSFVIIDQRGVVISQGGSGVRSIDVSNLVPGIYYIQAITKEGINNLRFIKE